ncbi:uncharacterized protein LOC107010124 [Solanum pennellii]|uniref:Uncharacterized protein LOC107010124 n=1 Tax=Solanum pennellii TaxID=28526 RepID=A0ABM1V2Q1_SOLPN|nr:uncharacterized protein LOC107010124 [Solanum pennellii]
MANSSHVRSISFPSRSQPEYLRVEIELNRLKTWESTSISSTTTPFSLNTIQQGLVGLAELYNCVQDLLVSPVIQQALLIHQMGRLAEEALEASVRLIDSCSTTRELVLMMKEQVQDLQSALRRKLGDSSIQSVFMFKNILCLKIVKMTKFRKINYVSVYQCIQSVYQPAFQLSKVESSFSAVYLEGYQPRFRFVASCTPVNLYISVYNMYTEGSNEPVINFQQCISAVFQPNREESKLGVNKSCFNAYISLRKKLKKDIAKSLKVLKQIENKIESFTQVDLDQSVSKLFGVLRQVSILTISVQSSQLYFLSSPASKAKQNGWSLLSKMLLTKSIAYKGDEKTINEVECVDLALCSYLHNNDYKVDVSMIQRKLQILNTGLQAIEAGTECLSRLLIRNRVCLLNILTP